MKLNLKNKKFSLIPKNNQTDPVKLPKLINPIENEMKLGFKIQMGKMIVDITKKIVDQTK